MDSVCQGGWGGTVSFEGTGWFGDPRQYAVHKVNMSQRKQTLATGKACQLLRWPPEQKYKALKLRFIILHLLLLLLAITQVSAPDPT